MTMLMIMVGCTALFASGAIVTYRADGWTWVSMGLAAGTVGLGFGSIIETLILRIELTDDAMIVTDLRGRRRYAMADIEGIEEARGCPPALLLKDGRWVTLPSVGNNLGNSVRAWLKAK
jgi:hypothetical protein